MSKIYVMRDRTKGRVMILKEPCYTPAGWHEPYSYSTLDNLSRTRQAPAQKKEAFISVNYLSGIKPKDVRAISPQVQKRLEDIDNQIRALRQEYQRLLNEEFLTFPLVDVTELPVSHAKVFKTKTEAENARLVRKS